MMLDEYLSANNRSATYQSHMPSSVADQSDIKSN